MRLAGLMVNNLADDEPIQRMLICRRVLFDGGRGPTYLERRNIVRYTCGPRGRPRSE